jgi:hypothetical protein
MEAMDLDGLIQSMASDANVLTAEQRNHMLQQRDMLEDEESEDEEEQGFNIDRFMGRESTTVKVDNNKPQKVELPPHVDPDTLVCKDAKQYMHIMIGSNNLPTSSYGEADFGFTPKSESKRTGKTWDKSKNVMFYDVKELIAEIDLDHHIFGLKGECSNKNFAVLKQNTMNVHSDLQNSVIKGIPVKSPLFFYSLKISRRKKSDAFEPNRYMQHNVWDCDSCKLNKKPLTIGHVVYLAYHMANLEQNEALAFHKELLNIHPELNNDIGIDFTWHDFETVMTNIKLGDYLMERQVPELMRYIYCNQMEFMTKFYKEKILLNMSPGHLEALYNKLRTSPFELFFFKMTHYTFRVYKKRNEKFKSKANEPQVDSVSVSDEPEEENPGDEHNDEENSMREFLDQLTFNRDIVFRSKLCFSSNQEIFWLFLPEIGEQGIEILRDKLDEKQVATIKVYSTLKRSYYSDFNSFEYKWGLMEGAFATSKDPNAMFDEVMIWLTETPMKTSKTHQLFNGYDYTLVKKLGLGYYYRESHLHTMCIVESLQLLFDRYIRSSASTKEEEEATEDIKNALGLDADKFLYSGLGDYFTPAQPEISNEIVSGCCSEQLIALYKHRDSPLIMISGKAGSGKTTLLKKIMQCYTDRKKVIACAFMGRNVAALATVFGGMAFTCHMLLYMHKKACATESWSTSNAFRRKDSENKPRDIGTDKEVNGIHYKRCPFEDIEVLIIDEMSLMTEELLCCVLSVFLKCSKLTKLVLCGDSEQLPPLGSGSPMKELRKFCEHMGILIEFKHNHRVDRDSRMLFDNCNAVADSKPELVVFDNKACIHEYWTAPYSETPCFDYGAQAVEILKKYQLDAYTQVILTRSNNVKDSINPVVDKYFRGFDCNDKTWRKDLYTVYKGSKIIFGKNLYLPDNVLINNEQLVVVDIEDFKPEAFNKKGDNRGLEDTLDRSKRKVSKYQQEMKSAVSDSENVVSVSNSASRRAFQGAHRRLRVSTLDHIAKSVDHRTKIIPFFGTNRQKVKKAYAITIHGAQGGEYDTVILMMPYKSDAWTRECIYTAMTRAKKRFILVGDLNVFTQAIQHSEPARLTELGWICIKNIAGRIPMGWVNWHAPNIYLDVKYLEENESVMEVDMSQFKDLWSELFGRMVDLSMENIKQIFRLRTVCKMFRDMIDSREMWIRIYKSVYYNTDPKFRGHYMITPEELNIKYMDDFGKLCRRVINCIGSYSWKFCSHPHNLITSHSLLSAILPKIQPDVTDLNQVHQAKFVHLVEKHAFLFKNVKICGCGKIVRNVAVAYTTEGVAESFTIAGTNPVFAVVNSADQYPIRITNYLMESHPDSVKVRREAFLKTRNQEQKKRKLPALNMSSIIKKPSPLRIVDFDF